MSPADDTDDATRDGLALIECVHRMDRAGVMAIMHHGDPELIAVFLARVAADLVEDFARWRALIGPYFASPPVVVHFDPLGGSA